MALDKFVRQRRARQATIGFLGATTPRIWQTFVDAFDGRLRELGWIDDHNISIDFRWAQGHADRYAALAAELVRDGVDIIVTSGTGPALAAKKATKTIPIVVAAVGDPIGTKLVKRLARPGGNITGTANGQTDLAGYRLQALRKVVPGLKRLAMLGYYSSRNISLEMEQIERKARRAGIKAVICDVRKASEIGPIIRGLKGKVDAIYVCTEPFITTHQVAINIAAASAGLPTMHAFREYVEMGGLMSYGPDFRAMFSRAADLVDQILDGKAPADIPIKVEKRCELVINANTAAALRLKIPKGVRRRAKIIQ
jgi:ABC-type uncharacterized transport system substrate-binding protein